MKKISIIFALILFFNCSKSNDDDGGTATPPAPEPPTAVALTFPNNNQECNEGTDVSTTQSSVTFTWTASTNTDSYDVKLKDLGAGTTTTHSSSTNALAITIKKATPYSWYVISKSTSTTTTAQSETWKFYNAGDGVQSHAPFPADLVTPTMGANLTGITTVTLEWSGSDIDGDITGYDVYFGTETTPTTQIGATQTATTIDSAVAAGNIYYWRIVTTDAEGNNSQSEIFQFRVD